MAINVYSVPIDITLSVLGTPGFWYVDAAAIEISFEVQGIRTIWPPALRDPTLDQELDLTGSELGISISIHGDWLNVGILADPIEVSVAPVGDFVSGVLVIADPVPIVFVIQDADIVLETTRKNWLKWSDIGSLDFTIGMSNVAGERPLDWSGWIYEIKKLENKVAVYGENGVSILTPTNKYYGLATIHRTGLYSQRSVVGTDEVHYFIDKNGQMWRLKDDLMLLDYSEFFSLMSDIVMSYDVLNNLIYICDGTYGYIYSPRTNSLGGGPVNITGVGTKDGELYVTSAGELAIPTFELWTDIYDMGTRKFKTIRSIEVGTDLTENMEASINYRVSNRVAFSSLDWCPVTLEGVSSLPCYGLEFRFGLRVLNYEYFEIDYLKINGLIHNYSYTEHTLHSINERRGALYDS